MIAILRVYIVFIVIVIVDPFFFVFSVFVSWLLLQFAIRFFVSFFAFKCVFVLVYLFYADILFIVFVFFLIFASASPAYLVNHQIASPTDLL